MVRLRAVDTDELERTKQESVARPLTEAEKLQLKAEMLRLQAEKLRLEADRDQIKMERETMLKKQVRTDTPRPALPLSPASVPL